jgi:hypothetical protein
MSLINTYIFTTSLLCVVITEYHSIIGKQVYFPQFSRLESPISKCQHLARAFLDYPSQKQGRIRKKGPDSKEVTCFYNKPTPKITNSLPQ